MPKDLNMAKTTAGPTDKTYPDTVIMSIRTALRFDLAATLCIIPLLRLLRKDTTIFEYTIIPQQLQARQMPTKNIK